jgi:hypothetical protein
MINPAPLPNELVAAKRFSGLNRPENTLSKIPTQEKQYASSKTIHHV